MCNAPLMEAIKRKSFLDNQEVGNRKNLISHGATKALTEVSSNTDLIGYHVKKICGSIELSKADISRYGTGFSRGPFLLQFLLKKIRGIGNEDTVNILDDMLAEPGHNYCDACFTGNYPNADTGIDLMETDAGALEK